MGNKKCWSIVSFLCHAGIPVEQEQPFERIREGCEQKTGMSKMRINKEEIDARGDDYALNENDYYGPTPQQGVIILIKAERQQYKK